jgi:hypothetical protein
VLHEGDTTVFRARQLSLRASVSPDGDRIYLEILRMTFTVTFPDGPEGDAARQVLPRALRVSHGKDCTVSRTVELGTPVDAVLAEN